MCHTVLEETERDVALGYRRESDKIDDESTNVHLLENMRSGHGQRGWYEFFCIWQFGYNVQDSDHRYPESLTTGIGKMLGFMEENKRL